MMFQFLCHIYEQKDLPTAEDGDAVVEGAVVDHAHRNGLIVIHKAKDPQGYRRESYSVTGKGAFVIERQRRRAMWLARASLS